MDQGVQKTRKARRAPCMELVAGTASGRGKLSSTDAAVKSAKWRVPAGLTAARSRVTSARVAFVKLSLEDVGRKGESKF